VTNDEIRAALLKHGDDKTPRELARMLGCPLHKIYGLRSKLGISGGQAAPWTAREERIVRSGVHMTSAEMARELGRSRYSVAKKRERLNAPYRGA